MDRENLLLWCRKKTNNPNLEDEGDFKFVLDQLIEMVQRVGITSESLADMSRSFSSETHKEVMVLLSPYRKARFL